MTRRPTRSEIERRLDRLETERHGRDPAEYTLGEVLLFDTRDHHVGDLSPEERHALDAFTVGEDEEMLQHPGDQEREGRP